MIPRVPDHLRDEVIRLRRERLSFREIAQQTRLNIKTVSRICESHFGNLVEQARAALRREINLARAEAHTSPPFHPPEWS